MRKIQLFLVMLVLFGVNSSHAQISTGKVVLKNMLIPGWGYAEIDGHFSQRSRRFMMADMAIIGTWLGLRAHNSALRNNVYAYANSTAGIDLRGVDRSLLIAVGNYENLESYNSEQLRLRNWNSLLPVTAENQWLWPSENDRARFNDIRDRQARIEQQLPAVFSLLVVNRLIAGIGAFKSANSMNNPVDSKFTVVPNSLGGFSTALSIQF